MRGSQDKTGGWTRRWRRVGGRLLWSVTVAAAGALAGPAAAHGIWVQPGPGPVYPIDYGDSTPEAYPAAKLQSLLAFDAEGRRLKAQLVPADFGMTVRIVGDPGLVAVSFDNGIFSKTADGRAVNRPRSQVPTAVTSIHPLKWGKTLLAWNAVTIRPLGQRLELVPLAETPPRVGQPFTVQLLRDGLPLAGVAVDRVGEDAENQGRRTGADGTVELVASRGLQRLAAELRLPALDEPGVDTVLLTTSLVFRVE